MDAMDIVNLMEQVQRRSAQQCGMRPRFADSGPPIKLNYTYYVASDFEGGIGGCAYMDKQRDDYQSGWWQKAPNNLTAEFAATLECAKHVTENKDQTRALNFASNF